MSNQPTDAGSGWKNDPKVKVARENLDSAYGDKFVNGVHYSETDDEAIEQALDALCAAVAASRGGEGTDDSKRCGECGGHPNDPENSHRIECSQVADIVAQLGRQSAKALTHRANRLDAEARRVAPGAEP